MKNLLKSAKSQLNDLILQSDYIEPSVIAISGTDEVVYNYGRSFFSSEDWDSDDYLTIVALDNVNIIYTGYSSKPIDRSINGGEWSRMSQNTTCHAGDVIKLKGNNTSYSGYYFTITGLGDSKGNWFLYGNTDSLINPDKESKFRVSTYSSSVFSGLFKNNTSLISANKVKINASSSYCCDNMFSGCSALKYVMDELPQASTYCFRYMFKGCSSLEDVSNLTIPVTAGNGCAYMFQNCSSLKKLPKLNIIEFYGACFLSMFENCTSLESGYDEFEVNFDTTVAGYSQTNSCFSAMYKGCSKLKSATKIKGTVTNGVCSNMFQNCTSLTTLPDDYFDDITYVGQNGFDGMFNGCINLINVPNLPNIDNIGSYAYYRMFKGCTNLSNVGCIGNWYAESNALQEMFQDCVKLERVNGIFINSFGENALLNMFDNCPSLLYINVCAINSDANITSFITNNYKDGSIYFLSYSSSNARPNWIPEYWYVSWRYVSNFVNIEYPSLPETSDAQEWFAFWESCENLNIMFSNGVIGTVFKRNDTSSQKIYSLRHVGSTTYSDLAEKTISDEITYNIGTYPNDFVIIDKIPDIEEILSYYN